MQVALDRHPRTRQQRARSPNPIAPPEGVTTERVLLLPGRQYYYHVKRAIRSAHSRVDLAMFHIAMPGRDHPTRQLLEALAAARDRGVRIRILVDRDRPDDPYGSVVINAPAIRFLRDAGVPVRVDAPQRLMHSKLIVIDADRTIVGSHNWSAGSYFAFDDLSVEVVSAEFARQARRRFGELWRRGKSPPRSR
jgi:phosphatidylserine/phosphatidylglycerophosphate/cardiolipin synthase-like enzyme